MNVSTFSVKSTLMTAAVPRKDRRCAPQHRLYARSDYTTDLPFAQSLSSAKKQLLNKKTVIWIRAIRSPVYIGAPKENTDVTS